MTPEKLDLIFPYVCFLYGLLMTVALHVPAVERLADEQFPSGIVSQWRSHRSLGLVCLLVGAAWILQNLWFAG
jgi:hypothetical protein